MYLNFYGLNKEPFNITPDPAFLFLSPSHKEALAVVMYGVENRKGFIVITGEVGLGKTTILRSYLELAVNERLKTVYLFNANVTFPALLETICRELAIPVIADDPGEMLRQLHLSLIQEYQRGFNIVLIVDEAQNMPLETLENIRMLSNLETDTDKLIQVIFIGQPEFDQLLDRQELRQLKQRIAVRAAIAPLNPKESAAYIRFRLARAGNREAAIFSPGALKRIVRHARGIPRVLNILCDTALITAFGYQKKQVNRAIAAEIIQDFSGKKKATNNFWRISFAALCFLVLAIVLVRFAPLPVLNRTTEKSLWNLLIQPNTNKIILPERVTEVPPIPEGGTSPDIQGVKAGDAPEKLVENVNRTTEKNLEVFLGQPITNQIPPGNVTEFPPTPKMGSSPDKRAIKAGNTQKTAEDANSISDKNPTNLPVLRPITHKVVLSGSGTEAQPTPKRHTFPVTRTVKVGDTLTTLVEDVYGNTDQQLIMLVKKHNKGITDTDRILVGDTIYFPPSE